MTIKNGDLPASPTVYADLATNGQRELYCDQVGLSKREQFAAMAMQGLLSCDNSESSHIAAQRAVECADALLFELENSK